MTFESFDLAVWQVMPHFAESRFAESQTRVIYLFS